jgi:hypothetical protein
MEEPKVFWPGLTAETFRNYVIERWPERTYSIELHRLKAMLADSFVADVDEFQPTSHGTSFVRRIPVCSRVDRSPFAEEPFAERIYLEGTLKPQPRRDSLPSGQEAKG